MARWKLSLWRDRVDLVEEKVFDIPFSNESPIGASDPVLTTTIEGLKELSFTLPRKYTTHESGEVLTNPLIASIVAESKIKLQDTAAKGDQWNDFIVTNVVESKAEALNTYICQDLATVELGKRGADIVLDTELENNYGTLPDLARKVLDGSGYVFSEDSDTALEYHEEPLYVVKLDRSLPGVHMISKQSKSLNGFLYIPFSQLEWRDSAWRTKLGEKTQVLWNNGTPFSEAQVEGSRLVSDIDHKHNYEVQFSTMNDYKAYLSGTLGDPSPVKMGTLKGRVLKRSTMRTYDPVMDRYVEKVQVTNSSAGASIGETINKWTEHEYTTTGTVRNLLLNHNNFTSLTHWGSDQELVPKTLRSTDESIKNVLTISSNGGSFYNSGPSRNRLKIVKGQQYIVATKVRRVKKDITELKGKEDVILDTPPTMFAAIYESYNGKDEEKIVSNSIRIRPSDNDVITDGTLDMLGYPKKGAKRTIVLDGDPFVYNHYVYNFFEATDNTDSPVLKIFLGRGPKDAGWEWVIEDIQLFPYLEGGNNLPIWPGEIPEGKHNTTSKYYKIVNGKEVLLAENDAYYEPIHRDNYESVRHINTADESHYNNLQMLSSQFDLWLDFVINHESDGRIKLINDPDLGAKRQDKSVLFYRYNPVNINNFAGFKEGINVQNISKNVDSSEITTKLNVKDVANEFAEDGIISIKRAKSNRSGESILYNFDYYISQGMIDEDSLVRDLYGADQNDNALYRRLSTINSTLNKESVRLQSLISELAALESERVMYRESVEAAVETLANLERKEDEYDEIEGQYNYKTVVRQANLNAIEKTKADLAFFRSELSQKITAIDGYNKLIYGETEKNYKGRFSTRAEYKILDTVSAFEGVNDEGQVYVYQGGGNTKEHPSTSLAWKKIPKNEWGVRIEVFHMIEQKLRLVKQFEKKYHRFIKEGVWSDGVYINDEEYYSDAQALSSINSIPRLSYEIAVADLSGIEGYQPYSFKVGDSTTIEDKEFFGERLVKLNNKEYKVLVKKGVLITESKQHLLNPEASTLILKTHKTNYEDLFTQLSVGLSDLQKDAEYSALRVVQQNAEEKMKASYANRLDITDQQIAEQVEAAKSDLADRIAAAPGVTIDWLNEHAGVLEGDVLAIGSLETGHFKTSELEALSANIQSATINALKAEKISADLIEGGIITSQKKGPDGKPLTYWDLDSGEFRSSWVVQEIEHQLDLEKNLLKYAGYMIYLTNESHTFVGDEDSAFPEELVFEVIAYRGAERRVVEVIEERLKTDIPGLSAYVVEGTNQTESVAVKVIATSDLRTKSGIISIPIKVDGIELVKEFSFALSLSGSSGYSNAVLNLYKRSNSRPSEGPGKLTYYFDSGELSGNLLNGWQKEVPEGDSPLYSISTVAIGSGSSVEIDSSRWGDPVLMTKDGRNNTTITLYQRKETEPMRPTDEIIYTFSTGEVSGATGDWKSSMPEANGFPLWVVQAVASSTSNIDQIEKNEWFGPVKMVEDGVDGYTPRKGVDYFDGKDGRDGYTPVKNVDYFDGKDGQDGEDGVSKFLNIRYSQHPNGSDPTPDPSGAKYIGIAVTDTDYPSASDYRWSLIKGTDGQPGEPGANGQTSYLHIKYSDDGKKFTANNGETVGKYIGTYVDFVEKDSDTFSRYTWNKVVGEDGKDGKDGKDGYTPVKNVDYFDGKPGQDGKDGADGESRYLHIRYSEYEDGTEASTDPTDAKYIGVAVTDSNTPPATSVYQWSLIKGTDGIAGEDGEDGQTSYLHIKYSHDGKEFTENNGETVGEWIGTYVDFEEDDSEEFSRYTWNKIVGEDGYTPVKGIDYRDGIDARIITLSASSQIIKKTKGQETLPEVVSITAHAQNTSATKWEYSLNNAEFKESKPIWVNLSGNTVTIDAVAMNAYSISIKASNPKHSVSDTITIAKVEDGDKGDSGSDSYTILLSNESHTFAGNTSGAIAEQSTTVDIIALKGTKEISATVKTPLIGETKLNYRVSRQSVIFTTTEQTQPNGIISIPIEVDGKIFTKTFSYSVSIRGRDGLSGYNQATLNLYQRSSSEPLKTTIPAVVTYTFETGAMKLKTGSMGDWSREVPQGNEPLYVTSVAAISTEKTVDIERQSWSKPVLMVKDGLDGSSGLNTATITLYKRSAEEPSAPRGVILTYSFSEKKITDDTSRLLGWTQSMPESDGNPLWVIQAVASSSTDTDDIPHTEWSAPIKMVEDGKRGRDAYNQARLYLYTRSKDPTIMSIPEKLIYSFYTGALELAPGSTWGPWSPEISSGTDPIYVISAAAISLSGNADILRSNWSEAVIMAKDGKDGSPGKPGTHGRNTATVSLYKRSFTKPSDTITTSKLNYDFTLGRIIETGSVLNGWETTMPDSDGRPLWITQAVASNVEYTDEILPREWSSPIKLIEDAKVIHLTGTGQVFLDSGDGNISPDNIVITAETQGISNLKWEYRINESPFSSHVPSGITEGESTVTIDKSFFGGQDGPGRELVSIRAYSDGVQDIFTVYRSVEAKDGQEGEPGADGASAAHVGPKPPLKRVVDESGNVTEEVDTDVLWFNTSTNNMYYYSNDIDDDTGQIIGWVSVNKTIEMNALNLEDRFRRSITETNERLDEVDGNYTTVQNTVTTHFDFTGEGLVIKSDDSDTQVVIEEKGLRIEVNNESVAHFNSEEIETKNYNVNGYLKLKNWQWMEDSRGNLVLQRF